jgi:hypothetical protein
LRRLSAASVVLSSHLVTDEAITYQPASRYWPWGCRAVPCASTEADTTTRSD